VVAPLVPVGTSLKVRLEDTLSSKDSRVGDRFTATILDPDAEPERRSAFADFFAAFRKCSMEKAGQVVALLNIGASTTNINILNGARSVFTRDATFGGNQYTSLLQKELGLTFDQAERVKRGMPMPEGSEHREIEPILDTVSDILALEIQKTMDFYRATVEDGESAVQKILVSGGGSKLKGLVEFLARRFEIPAEVFDPFRKIRVDSRGFDPEYMREIVPEMAIAVGLALRGVDVR